MLNNIGLPGVLVVALIILPIVVLVLRALWRVGSKK